MWCSNAIIFVLVMLLKEIGGGELPTIVPTTVPPAASLQAARCGLKVETHCRDIDGSGSSGALGSPSQAAAAVAMEETEHAKKTHSIEKSMEEMASSVTAPVDEAASLAASSTGCAPLPSLTAAGKEEKEEERSSDEGDQRSPQCTANHSSQPMLLFPKGSSPLVGQFHSKDLGQLTVVVTTEEDETPPVYQVRLAKNMLPIAGLIPDGLDGAKLVENDPGEIVREAKLLVDFLSIPSFHRVGNEEENNDDDDDKEEDGRGRGPSDKLAGRQALSPSAGLVSSDGRIKFQECGASGWRYKLVPGSIKKDGKVVTDLCSNDYSTAEAERYLEACYLPGLDEIRDDKRVIEKFLFTIGGPSTRRISQFSLTVNGTDAIAHSVLQYGGVVNAEAAAEVSGDCGLRVDWFLDNLLSWTRHYYSYRYQLVLSALHTYYEATFERILQPSSDDDDEKMLLLQKGTALMPQPRLVTGSPLVGEIPEGPNGSLTVFVFEEGPRPVYKVRIAEEFRHVATLNPSGSSDSAVLTTFENEGDPVIHQARTTVDFLSFHSLRRSQDGKGLVPSAGGGMDLFRTCLFRYALVSIEVRGTVVPSSCDDGSSSINTESSSSSSSSYLETCAIHELATFTREFLPVSNSYLMSMVGPSAIRTTALVTTIRGKGIASSSWVLEEGDIEGSTVFRSQLLGNVTSSFWTEQQQVTCRSRVDWLLREVLVSLERYNVTGSRFILHSKNNVSVTFVQANLPQPPLILESYRWLDDNGANLMKGPFRLFNSGFLKASFKETAFFVVEEEGQSKSSPVYRVRIAAKIANNLEAIADLIPGGSNEEEDMVMRPAETPFVHRAKALVNLLKLPGLQRADGVEWVSSDDGQMLKLRYCGDRGWRFVLDSIELRGVSPTWAAVVPCGDDDKSRRYLEACELPGLINGKRKADSNGAGGEQASYLFTVGRTNGIPPFLRTSAIVTLHVNASIASSDSTLKDGEIKDSRLFDSQLKNQTFWMEGSVCGSRLDWLLRELLLSVTRYQFNEQQLVLQSNHSRATFKNVLKDRI